MIASVLCPDPVIFVDDRWLYDLEDELNEVVELDLSSQEPTITIEGKDLTIVGSSYASYLAREGAKILHEDKISAEVIDVRVLNPLRIDSIVDSVKKTGHLLVVDSGWLSGGFASEIVAKVVEKLPTNCLRKPPIRLALPDAPAPSSPFLENDYYLKSSDVVEAAKKLSK